MTIPVYDTPEKVKALYGEMLVHDHMQYAREQWKKGLPAVNFNTWLMGIGALALKRHTESHANPQQVTKSDIMQCVVEGISREMFDHSMEGSFDISAMRYVARKYYEDCKALVPLEVVIDHVRENCVTDPSRVQELSVTSWECDPGLVVYYPSTNTHLLIDGHHRILRRHAEGCKDFLVYMLPEEAIIRPNMELLAEHGDVWGDKVMDGTELRGRRPGEMRG